MEEWAVRWRVKEYLEQHGKTAYALMKASGVSQATTYAIVQGKKTGLDFSTLAAIIRGLEEITGQAVTPNDLLEVVRG